METRLELYGSTGRMRGRRGVRVRPRTARSCMADEQQASSSMLVFASIRARAWLMHDTAHA
jgi:hypothetical protein